MYPIMHQSVLSMEGKLIILKALAKGFNVLSQKQRQFTNKGVRKVPGVPPTKYTQANLAASKNCQV